VEIRCGTEVAPELLDERYDSVVVATGAAGIRHGWTMLHPDRWNGPPLPGADQDNVFSYTELLEQEPRLGPQVMVIDSMGGRQGAVVAEYLAERGHAVEFVTQLGQPSPDLAASRDWAKVHGMLRRHGVRFTVDQEPAAIAGRTVTLRDLYTGESVQRDGVDAVVFCLGAAARDQLFEALLPRRARGLDLRLIGDALAPRRVSDAIREGELAAREI
jgi:hypothetical protein